MSIQAIAWVLERSEARLGERCVLLAIANHADARGENAWPSVSTIAREARLSEREVQRSVRLLVDMGELEVQYCEGPRGTNRYRIPKMWIGPLFAEQEKAKSSAVKKPVENAVRG